MESIIATVVLKIYQLVQFNRLAVLSFIAIYSEWVKIVSTEPGKSVEKDLLYCTRVYYYSQCCPRKNTYWIKCLTEREASSI